MKAKFIFHMILLFSITLASCESAEERQKRIAKIERDRIELEEKRKAQEAERAFKLEQERIEKEARLEKERQEREIYERYINNSLRTGATPYSHYYGSSLRCSGSNCSQIRVTTPWNSDVLVTIKSNGEVVSHAYIVAGNTFTFNLPNGTYQTFFYYGKGWYPEKIIKQTSSGTLKGGFIDDEVFGKDDPEVLRDVILTYELVLQQNGNFSTSPSNANEAL